MGKDMRSKGQILVMIGIFAALTLIMIRTYTSYNFEEQRFQKYPFLTQSFSNIKQEFQTTVDTGFAQSKTHQNIEEKINKFSFFLEKQFPGQMSLFYSFASFHDDSFNITIGNFLNQDIKNVNVSQNITGETQTISEIKVGTSKSLIFSAPSIPSHARINITYQEAGIQKKEVYTSQTDKYNFFFDLTLTSDSSFIGDKFQFSD